MHFPSPKVPTSLLSTIQASRMPVKKPDGRTKNIPSPKLSSVSTTVSRRNYVVVPFSVGDETWITSGEAVDWGIEAVPEGTKVIRGALDGVFRFDRQQK